MLYRTMPRTGDRVSIKYEVRGRRATSGKIYISLSGFMLTKI